MAPGAGWLLAARVHALQRPASLPGLGGQRSRARARGDGAASAAAAGPLPGRGPLGSMHPLRGAWGGRPAGSRSRESQANRCWAGMDVLGPPPRVTPLGGGQADASQAFLGPLGGGGRRAGESPRWRAPGRSAQPARPPGRPHWTRGAKRPSSCGAEPRARRDTPHTCLGSLALAVEARFLGRIDKPHRRQTRGSQTLWWAGTGDRGFGAWGAPRRA